MLMNDALRDPKPKSSSLAWFCRKERIKNVMTNISGNARTIVTHDYANCIVRSTHSNANLTFTLYGFRSVQ